MDDACEDAASLRVHAKSGPIVCIHPLGLVVEIGDGFMAGLVCPSPPRPSVVIQSIGCLLRN